MRILCTLALASGILCGLHAKAQEEATRPVHPHNAPLVTKASRIGEIPTTTGRTFTNSQLNRMPARDVNTIANTVTGVDSRNGATPNIRGASASGTAYFVDGVRTYAPLPVR